jgi:hypothetical protein
MDPGIGPSGTVQGDGLIGHDLERIFQNGLDGRVGLLPLPPVVIGAVILEIEPDVPGHNCEVPKKY